MFSRYQIRGPVRSLGSLTSLGFEVVLVSKIGSAVLLKFWTVRELFWTCVLLSRLMILWSHEAMEKIVITC